MFRLATLKPKLRRICCDEKASHLNQVLMLSVLRDEKRKKKREVEKIEKWRINRIQSGTSVGGDVGWQLCRILVAGLRGTFPGNFVRWRAALFETVYFPSIVIMLFWMENGGVY